MTETAQTPPHPEDLRSEARLLRGTFRALREDLITGAFAFRPLQPLADDSKALRYIPARCAHGPAGRRTSRWSAAAAFVGLLGTAADRWTARRWPSASSSPCR